ncbi:hypothetical protein BHO_0900013 [Borrelia hermsii YBT]|nr:hypothetical protein BHO_0900013 [Borrelia hermsii YBT]
MLALIVLPVFLVNFFVYFIEKIYCLSITVIGA